MQVSKAIFPQLQVAVGYAHIFTGAFLRKPPPARPTATAIQSHTSSWQTNE